MKPRENHVSTSLYLWRVIGKHLPEAVHEVPVEKSTVTFKLTARGGTEAVAVTRYDQPTSPYEAISRTRRDKIMEPYRLYKELEESVGNFPQNAVRVDITIDPNGVPKIKATILPVLKKGEIQDGE